MHNENFETPQSLQEVSERLAVVDHNLVVSKARIEELQQPLDEERGRNRALKNEKERLLQALQVSKRAYSIAQARQAFDSDAEPVVIVRERGENYGKVGLPEVWELVAVAADGTGLYKHEPSKITNYRGKERNIRPSDGYAIRTDAVPAKVAALVEAYDAAYQAERVVYDTEDYSDARSRKINAMRKGRHDALMDGYEALGISRHAQVRRDERSGLTSWQARGRGDWGAYKPLAPPAGGRWRWLKVEEQSELPTEVMA